MVVTRYVFPYRLRDETYLLINSLTGAVDVVEKDVMLAFAAIRRGQSPDLALETVEGLQRRGYMYESREAEDAAVARAFSVNEKLRARDQAICFVLCTTFSCNLRCPYCFEPHSLHERRGAMSLEQVDLAFDAIDAIRRRRSDIGSASINLFGGEPLLPANRDIVARMLERAAERCLPVSITSNGTNAHRFIETLRPYREQIMFDISIDGVKEVHDQRRFTAKGLGTFELISENVDLLLREGFRVCVRININDRNVDSVHELLEYVRERGWHRYAKFEISASPVTSYTGNAEDGLIPPSEVELRLAKTIPPELLKEVPLMLNGDVSRVTLPLSKALGQSMVGGGFLPSMYYCEASGALFYCMGPDGQIYPCNQILGSPEWSIGTFFPTFQIDEAAAALWQGRAVTNMPKCRECSIAFMCGGGCPVLAKRSTGSPMDSHCGTTKRELATYIRTMAPQVLDSVARSAAGDAS